MTKHVFPTNALQKQKRYMRRYMRKPRGIGIKEYDARLTELNEYLKWFCDDETADNICPRQDQSLDADELLDIVYFSIPNKWSKQLIVQGFNATEKSREDLVAFCERMEECEAMEKDTDTKTNRSSTKSRQSGKRKASGQGNGSYCMLHGRDKGHDSSDCKVLQAQAKRMRGTYEARSESDRAKLRKENRYSRTISKKAELHAIVTASVDKALKQTLSNIGKRKRVQHDLQVSEDLSEASFQKLDEVSEGELDGFNFEDLKVSDNKDDSDSDDVSL